MDKQLHDSSLLTGKPKTLTEDKKDTIMYAVMDLIKKNPEVIIGNLEYTIHKLTTHPDLMKEVDFQAAKSAQELVHFLRVINTI